MLDVKFWATMVAIYLGLDNSFAQYSINHDSFLSANGKSVIMPLEGSDYPVLKNPTVFPLSISNSIENGVEYPLDFYCIEPKLISDIEQYQISYDKGLFVLKKAGKNIPTVIHNDLLWKWVGDRTYYDGVTQVTSLQPLPATQIIDTTGTAHANGRFRVTYQDLLDLKTKFDDQNVPLTDRHIIFSTVMHNDILNLPELEQAWQLFETLVTNGEIKRLLGFEVHLRSWTPSYTALGALKAYNHVPAPLTDRLSAVAWDVNAVAKALGRVKPYYDKDKPEYLGSLFNLKMYCGGTRELDLGVAVLRQGV
jgi:hypothetical protein